MIIFLVIVGIIILCVCMSGSAGNSKNSVQQKQYVSSIKDTSWHEPRPDRLWDSIDYFVRLGEELARYKDDTMVTINVCVDEFNNRKRGSFRINFSDFSSARTILKGTPYFERFPQEDYISFEGYDANSTLIEMSEEELRNLILQDAPHASVRYFRGNGVVDIFLRYSEYGR